MFIAIFPIFPKYRKMGKISHFYALWENGKNAKKNNVSVDIIGFDDFPPFGKNGKFNKMIDFSKYGIKISSGKFRGQTDESCPQCRHMRKKKNAKPLSVNLDIGLFKCHHCGWSGIAIDNGKHWSDKIKPMPKQKVIPYTVPKQPSLIPPDIYRQSMQHYDTNNFIKWLYGIVGQERAKEAIRKYNVGCSKYCGNATVYWYVDIDGGIRSAKVIPYGNDGHRRKDANPNWAHSLLKIQGFEFVRCLYGEHLLKDTSKPVFVVESEKAAVISSIYFTEYTWVSCGGADGLNEDVCSVLRGRQVIFYPDCGKYDDWKIKAEKLSKKIGFSYTVSSLIEKNATEQEREKGSDIADYLVRHSPDDFLNYTKKNTTVPDSTRNNQIVDAMIAKNKALKKMIEVFDCEVTNVDTWEPEPSPMLTIDELKKLAAGLPDYNSWTENELCRMFNTQPEQIRKLTETGHIYYIGLSERFCKGGCTPF